MNELGVKMGEGWKHGGPNAPLDALELALRNAQAMGARAGSLILGLPLYGRLYICDGDDGRLETASPRCTCAEKNFHKKTLDIMAACKPSSGCTTGYDVTSASPWWDCPGGTAASCIQGLPANQSELHQQGWYEDAKSIKAKVGLAASYESLVAGVGAWTAHGADGSTAGGSAQVDALIWDTFRDYLNNSRG